MKHYLRLMLVVGLILPPTLCGASYLIEFKSGSKFVTSHYWTTGNKVDIRKVFLNIPGFVRIDQFYIPPNIHHNELLLKLP